MIYSVSYYLWWWILIFAGLSLMWALFWFIAGLMKLRNADGLYLRARKCMSYFHSQLFS
ncbi:MAG TPA: hypothetical protein VMW53_13215 [archaeon]|nr:hypothetical protein [archaeon]